ncbi:unnamed protein product [Soboliphyme baturini]|uniref:Secreted protein n=1 Tax=Soboliphyme baturini TaxID=241478 RepID=A0A183IBA2_9BILA|nr:unnamed protein product [Soboliphyme baturini]
MLAFAGTAIKLGKCFAFSYTVPSFTTLKRRRAFRIRSSASHGAATQSFAGPGLGLTRNRAGRPNRRFVSSLPQIRPKTNSIIGGQFRGRPLKLVQFFSTIRKALHETLTTDQGREEGQSDVADDDDDVIQRPMQHQ